MTARNGSIMKYFTALLAYSLPLIIFACSGSKQTIQPGTKTALVFYYEAEENIKQQDFPTALSNLDSAIYYNPGFASLYQLKGWVLENLDQPDSAIAAYESYLNYRSTQPEILWKVGELCLDVGKNNHAATYLKKAVQLYPDTSEIHFQLGKANYNLGYYTLAQDYFQSYQKLEEMPKNEFWKWSGMAYFESKKYAKAIKQFEKYAEIEKEDPEALKYLGLANFESGEYEDAITYLNFAESYLKGDPEIYLYRSRYYQMADKPEIAQQELMDALQFDSLNVNILYELAVLNHEEQEYAKCQTYMMKVVELDSEYWRAYRYLGFLAEREGNLNEARSYYKLYLENTYERDEEVRQRFESVTTGVREE